MPRQSCCLPHWAGARLVLAVAMIVLTGCAEVPKPIVAPPEVAYPNIRVASRNAALVLADQIRAVGKGEGAVWVSPAINVHSGEITASGRELQILTALDLKTLLGDVVVKSLGAKEDAQWSWVLAPSVQFEKPKSGAQDDSWFRVSVAAISPTGKSLPGITLRVNARQFDATPSRFYREAPLVLTGSYHETRQEVAKGGGSSIPVEARNRFITIEGLLQEAVLRYESGDYPEALAGFDRVIARDSSNLTALSGRYQALIERGDATMAEAALSALMDAAIKQGNISFKFLFQVRSVEFRDDLDISRRYQSWLKQIARHLSTAGVCVNVLGHASRSGSFDYNMKLSTARATQIMQQLLAYELRLKGRVSAEGRGYQDNVIGSGSDDATDAIDRRVDFKIVTCSQG